MHTFVFGHKNPDTDSVASAVAFSYLKNKLGDDTIPCVLGSINKESKYVLNKFNIPNPKFIENVKTQVKDLDIDVIEGVKPNASIQSVYKFMINNKKRTMPVVDEENKLLGIITMKDIAMGLIKGDFYDLHTSLSNIVNDLDGEILVGEDQIVKGSITVGALYYTSIKEYLNENKVIIVGDRYDIIEYAIQSNVKLIIVTGGKKISKACLDLAKKKNIPIISVPMDTYTASKLINQCNYVCSIMKKDDIVKFHECEYLEDVREEMSTMNHVNYPIVDEHNTFLGLMSRKHILKPTRKKVIIVDHNEYSQSAEGLQEADVVEIIDHHKLGDISTSAPISFRNMPVGSTCTIVHKMFKENNVEIPYEIAGALLSAIISDTLFFRSPTTTDFDRQAVEELNHILKLDVDQFAMDMFKAGSSIEGESIEDIFYKDFKDFVLEEENKVGVGQVFTLDIDDVLNRKEDFMKYINKVHEENNYCITLLLITDIMKEGSYLLFKCNNDEVISSAFHVESQEGVFVPGVVSRKKQVMPKLTEALKMVK